MLREGLLCATVVLAACTAAEPEPSAPRPTCAPPSTRIQFPTPYWDHATDAGLRLGPPSGDAIAAVVASRQAWVDGLAEVDGLASRPTFLVALDGPAAAIDPARIALVALGATAEPLAVPIDAHLDEIGSALVARPHDPLPLSADGVDLALVVRSAAVTGAAAIPSCPPEGTAPTGAYDDALEAARAAVPDALLAVPFRRASREEIHLASASAPPAEVSRVSSIALADLEDFAPDAELAALLVDPAPRGIFETPLFLDEHQRMHADPASGSPVAQGITRPGFVVALPKTAARPLPWILFQHGGGGDKRAVFQIARPFVERGIALVGVDLLYHGDRAEKAAGGSGAEYIDFVEPLRMRDMLLQTSADHLSVLAGVDALNAALAPLTGVSATLDPARVYYVGHSLGALSGGLTLGVSSSLSGGVLVSGGGGWEDILNTGYFSVLVLDVFKHRSALEHDAAAHLLQTLLDGGDPLAYAGRFSAAEGTTVLLLEAVDEEVFGNVATDQLARAWGAELALPAHHEVLGVPTRALPRTGEWVRMLVQFPMTELSPSKRHGALLTYPSAMSLAAGCIGGLAARGACTVEDTGFAPGR